MITYKVRHKHYISNLYLPEKKSGKVVLLLSGLPPSNNINNILNIFLNTGAIVYAPSFSGMLDSEGLFSVKNAIKDVNEFYNLATKTKIRELYYGKNIEIGKVKEIILVGMSFGSIIALLGHKNKFNKMILLSSAFLFNPKDFPTKKMGKDFNFQMKRLLYLLKNAFPYSCRMDKNSDVEDFLMGKSYLSQKKTVIDKLNNLECKTLILHGKNDTSVPFEIIKSIQKEVNNYDVVWEYTESSHSTNSYKNKEIEIITNFVLHKNNNIKF